MRLTFCVACGSTDDLQHRHLVTRAEGGGDEETNLITLCCGCRYKLHGRQKNREYSASERIKAGLAAARARGLNPGHKSHAELWPDVVALAKQLRRKRPEGGQRSYAQISAELFAAGHANSRGRPFSASSIASMLSLGNPRSEEYVPIARAALVAAADARAEALRPVLAELVGRPFVAAAAELDRRGHPTASGKPWSAASVRNAMLRLGLYQPLLKKGASGTKPRKRAAE